MKSTPPAVSDVTFREVQRFRQPWLWALLLGIMVPVLVLVAIECYRPLITGTISTEEVAGLMVVVVVVGGSLWFMAALKLVIEVRPEALYVRLWPVRKQVFYDEIARCEARTYSPIKEYGGWGIRWSLRGRGKAYNVSGNEGVQLEFENGKRVLLGSQRTKELEIAIRARLSKDGGPQTADGG